MNRVTKVLIVLFCVSLCAAGAILSHKENAKQDRPKTKVVPVNNRSIQSKVWIWA
jgi:hypothetical protein